VPEREERSTAVVERGLEDQVATEALLALRAKKDASKRVFDPRLGATREEATAKAELIRNDLGAYGEFVHGHTPARHHRLWVDLIHGLVSGTLTDVAIRLGLLPEDQRGTYRNKLLLLAPPASAKSSWCSVALPTWYLVLHLVRPRRRRLRQHDQDPARAGQGAPRGLPGPGRSARQAPGLEQRRPLPQGNPDERPEPGLPRRRLGRLGHGPAGEPPHHR
jgi:hypothetical protein